MTRNVFFLAMILAASGLLSPPVALALGLVFGLSFQHPYHLEARKLSGLLLKISVVGLGFGMDLGQVLRAGATGFVYTACGIAFALTLGWLLGKLLRVPSTTSMLISSGTAICGGSAIAAMAPILEAGEEEIAVSLGTVFVLNSIALLAFPPIGAALGLSQQSFGLWAALAIHDTSSVVGASARYGVVALSVATTVKLARALWIVPVSLGAAAVRRSKTRVQIPWFIFFFVLAAVAKTYLPVFDFAYPSLKQLGLIGLTVTLFLIGSGLNRKTLRTVGVRPMLQGVLLWIVVATVSLALIRAGWIHL